MLLKKSQCTWLLIASNYNINAPVGEQFTPAHYCGKAKQPKAKNPNYPDEGTEYESFCPEHMARWAQIRKEKAHRIEDEDIDFDV